MKELPDYDLLYEIAERQAGYFTAKQAESVNFTWERLSNNVKNGRFLRIQNGIYRLNQFPASTLEDFFAAWLKSGQSAVISHESALILYGLTDLLPGEIHVTVPRTASRRRTGVKLHTYKLTPQEITTREGLPVTTIERTILDILQSAISYEHIQQAIQQALQRGLLTSDRLLGYAATRSKRSLRKIEQILNSINNNDLS